ncbi:MAG: CHAD domain-containing protein [Chitinophagaceae bacterium]
MIFLPLMKVPATLFILLHWKKQQKLFFGNLNKLRSDLDANAIHDLRVAFKKIRSYQKLVAIISGQDNDKLLFEKTEQLFSVLGKHRDIEAGLLLLQALEKEYKTDFIELKEHLKAVSQQTARWVQDALKDYDAKELTELTMQSAQNLEGTNRQDLLDKVRIIIDKKLRVARRLTNHLDRHPHTVRKLYKNIFYWATTQPKDILLNSGELKKIKRALEYLGDWQDHEMLRRKIKHFRKDFLPGSKEEYTLLKNLEDQIEAKKKKMLDKAKAII